MSKEMEPCAMCGGRPELTQDQPSIDHEAWRVICPKGCLQTGSAFAVREHCINAWNYLITSTMARPCAICGELPIWEDGYNSYADCSEIRQSCPSRACDNSSAWVEKERHAIQAWNDKQKKVKA